VHEEVFVPPCDHMLQCFVKSFGNCKGLMFLLPDVPSILAYGLGLVVDFHCGSAGACYWRLCFVIKLLVDGVIKSNAGAFT
jgi:hypothetical protein